MKGKDLVTTLLVAVACLAIVFLLGWNIYRQEVLIETPISYIPSLIVIALVIIATLRIMMTSLRSSSPKNSASLND